jgi:hypothetical protein
MELVYGLGALLLGGAIAWAMASNTHRSARNQRIGAAAVREQYRHPDSYDPGKFRRGLTPEK